MNDDALVTTLLNLSSAAVGFAANWLLQSTLLIAAGLLAGLALRQRGSAAQSVVYRTTLVAVLLCPLATCVLALGGWSGWSLEMPAAWDRNELSVAHVSLSEPMSSGGEADAIPPLVDSSSHFADSTPAHDLSRAAGVESPVAAEMQGDRLADRAPAPSPHDSEPAHMATVAVTTVGDPAVVVRAFGALAIALTSVWFVASSTLLARLAFAWWDLARLRRRTVAADVETQAACRALASLLDVRMPAVLRSPYVPSPCLAGVVRPAIMLPDDEIELPLRDVLIHELAHLKRHDCLWKLLHRLAAAVFWFQPLLWKLAHRIEATSEEVCDDHVVQFGCDRRQYAHGLVDVAELSAAPSAAVGAVGVGIVSLRSMLAHRVSRILDNSRALSTRVGRVSLALVLLSGLLSTVLVGVVGLKRSTANASTTALDIAISADERTRNEEDESPNDEVVLNYQGQIVGPDDQPISGAKLYFEYWQHGAQPNDLLAPLAVTDAEGKFQVDVPLADLMAPYALGAQLVASARGFGVAMRPSVDLETTGEALKRLSPEARKRALARQTAQSSQIKLVADDVPISGQVVTTEGTPIAGVRVRVKDLWLVDSGSLDGFEKAAREPKADFYSLRRQTTSGINGPQLPSIVRDATTDADGRFTFSGIGRERVVELIISGDGIETKLVRARTRAGETIVVPNGLGDDNLETFEPATFVHVVGPTQTLTGKITDAETGKPLADVLVSAGQRGSTFSMGKPYLATRSQADGQFRLEGLSIGSEEDIYAIPTDASGYLPAASTFTAQLNQPSAERNFRLKQGIWVRGQAIDKRTGKPVVGHVKYNAFEGNPSLKAYEGFTRGATTHERRTDDEGRFEIAVIPGPGILTFSADDHTQFRRAAGLENVKGPTESVSAGGTTVFRTVPMRVVSSNAHFLYGIDLARDVPPDDVKFELDSGVNVAGKLFDAEKKPLAGVIVSGISAPGGGWYETDGNSFTVKGYYAEAPRELFFYQPERNLAAYYSLQGEPPQVLDIVLEPAGNLTARLVEEDGAPRANVRIAGSGIPGDNVGREELRLATDRDGRFLIRGLVPEHKYTVIAGEVPRFGQIAVDVSVAAGEVKDLGDVKVRPLEELMAASDPQSTILLAERSTAAAKTTRAGTPTEKSSHILRGRVTSGDGKPVANADLAVIAQGYHPARGGDLRSRNVVLVTGTTQADGSFELSFESPASQNYKYPHLIARAEGMAIQWKRFDLNALATDVSLELQAESLLRGRLVDIEGQPAADVELRLESVMEPMRDEKFPERAIGFSGDPQPPAWPRAFRSDKEGRFAVPGVPEGCGVFLAVAASDRFAPQDIALNTGLSEQRGERDGTYRPLVKNLKPHEEAVLPLSPAQTFEGTIRYADTGQAAPQARLTIWASQQKFGSMTSVAGTSDAVGHFRLHPEPGIRFGINAYPPDDTPYLAISTPLDKAYEWKAADRVKQVDLTLPRGVLVRGRVTVAGTNAPIAGASIQYVPESENNARAKDNILTGWQDIQISDADGNYRIAVLPGPGRIIVHAPAMASFVVEEIGDRELHAAKPGGQRVYAHAIRRIEPAAEQESLDLAIELTPGATVDGTIVDDQGAPVATSIVVSELMVSPYSLTWNAQSEPQPGNKFELVGLTEGREYKVHVLEPKRRLGATRMLSSVQPSVTIALEACGEATARFVDAEGQPMKSYRPHIELAMNDGVTTYDYEAQRQGKLAADSEYVANIDQTNYWPGPITDDNGHVTFSALIPGAKYWLIEIADGKSRVIKEFTVEAAQKLDLGEVVVRASK